MCSSRMGWVEILLSLSALLKKHSRLAVEKADRRELERLLSEEQSTDGAGNCKCSTAALVHQNANIIKYDLLAI